jgi:hypothetical protein
VPFETALLSVHLAAGKPALQTIDLRQASCVFPTLHGCDVVTLDGILHLVIKDRQKQKTVVFLLQQTLLEVGADQFTGQVRTRVASHGGITWKQSGM